MCLAKCTSCATTDHVKIVLVSYQEVAVELLEDLHGFVLQLLKVEIRVILFHCDDGFGTGRVRNNLINALVSKLDSWVMRCIDLLSQL